MRKISKKRKVTMAQRKTELQQAQEDIAEVKGILEEAYTVESSREDLAEAVGKALGVLEDYDTEDEDDNGDSDGD